MNSSSVTSCSGGGGVVVPDREVLVVVYATHGPAVRFVFRSPAFLPCS